MARDGAVYVCQSCGAAHSKWSGQCPACGAWNSLVEEVQTRAPGSLAPSRASRARGLNFQGLEEHTPAPPRIGSPHPSSTTGAPRCAPMPPTPPICSTW